MVRNSVPAEGRLRGLGNLGEKYVGRGPGMEGQRGPGGHRWTRCVGRREPGRLAQQLERALARMSTPLPTPASSFHCAWNAASLLVVPLWPHVLC